MTEYDSYYRYLLQRSAVGRLYRTYWLYPRIGRRLNGLTLDIGCGLGDFLQFRRPDTIGVDINERTVSHCRLQGLDARLMVPDRLPFDAASFDSVLLDNVLEHVDRPQPLLAEIFRVLRPAGTLLVGVPGPRGWASDPDHKVKYDERTLSATLTDGGFSVVEQFHTPLFRSDWLGRRLRQYCIYAVAVRVPGDDRLATEADVPA